MNGRRSHPRLIIAAPADAVLRVLRDVTLERTDGNEIIAISRDARVVGEQLKLDVAGEEHHRTRDVRIVESRPAVIDGNLRHRLRLADVSKAEAGRVGHARKINGSLGVLTREIHVRIVNCSSSGCLIESHVRLDVGTVVALRLFIVAREFADEVKVVRCQTVEGAGSVYHLGAQYVWIDPPDDGSLRLVAQYLAAPANQIGTSS